MFISSQLSLISKLSLALTDFNALGDTESCLTLRCSIIISLTTLAELYHVLARNPMSTDSSAAEFGEKCMDALGDMMSVAEGLGSDDFRFLDPFLGVSSVLSCHRIKSTHERTNSVGMLVPSYILIHKHEPPISVVTIHSTHVYTLLPAPFIQRPPAVTPLLTLFTRTGANGQRIDQVTRSVY